MTSTAAAAVQQLDDTSASCVVKLPQLTSYLAALMVELHGGRDEAGQAVRAAALHHEQVINAGVWTTTTTPPHHHTTTTTQHRAGGPGGFPVAPRPPRQS